MVLDTCVIERRFRKPPGRAPREPGAIRRGIRRGLKRDQASGQNEDNKRTSESLDNEVWS